MRLVMDHEIIDHGRNHEQYFQGCGVAFTEFADCYTGIGNSKHEALEDALECAAQCDWDVDGIKNTLSARDYDLGEDEHFYVSIRLK